MFHLFSKKKKTGEPFLFRIEDTFAMKNGDCVLAGEVTQGSIHVEDEFFTILAIPSVFPSSAVSCYPSPLPAHP